jgi:hypothetical protein
MVQPKYSPEEALQRIKLMMEYDSSKTLDENKEMISEQPTPGELGLGTAGALAGGAYAAGGLGALAASAGIGVVTKFIVIDFESINKGNCIFGLGLL